MSIDPSTFEPEGEEHANREKWRITDASAADWALRKLAQARNRITENNTLADKEVHRIRNWADETNEAHERDIEYFESVLRQWHDEQLADDPKRKTISLPGGKLQARQNPDSVEITDPDTFFVWAQENDSIWLRVKYEPDKNAIKKA